MDNNNNNTNNKEEKKNSDENVIKIIDKLYLNTKNKTEEQTTRTFLSCKILYNNIII
jgi:hypothetical protein